MIITRRVQTNTTNFEYILTSNNQGYLAHWKLTWTLFLQVKTMHNMVNKTQKLKLWLSFLIKLPWWLFIKPLGVALSTKTTYKGSFSEVLHDGRVNKREFYKQHKVKFFKIMGVIVWINWGGFNNNDIILLTEKYTIVNS